MEPFQEHLKFIVEKQGPETLNKQRFPIRFGTCSEIKTRDFEFCFNLNGEIQSIRGLRTDWPIRRNCSGGRRETTGSTIPWATRAETRG